MWFEGGFWTGVVQFVNVITFNTVDYGAPAGGLQVPLDAAHAVTTTLDVTPLATPQPPVFAPPNGPQYDNFVCDYSAMKGYRYCSTPQNRGCWLRKDPEAKVEGPDEYNIHTNYDKVWPTGKTRKYELTVTNMTLAPDGFKMIWGKVFDKQYPGPWIQACWGDTIEITVKNKLPYNGTAIHWHGVRQLNSVEMDGVNAVTQCPIAPQDQFTYRFNVTQYGTSWYHSHYSLQYADGMAGPMTFYGPSSDDYDDAVDPILFTDWNHRSAFEDFYQEITPGLGPPFMTSVLLNGIGNYTCTDTEKKAGNCTTIPERYNTTFTTGKKYLMRIINTSAETTFIFSIDEHNLTVIANDFVPIVPYETNAVLVGIGQRYHIIVEATKPLELHDNYWIRVTSSPECSRWRDGNPSDTLGIIRYDPKNKRDPTTKRHRFSDKCTDEPYRDLVPVVPWTVAAPQNQQQDNTFQVGLSIPTADRPLPHGNLSRWELGPQSMWLNFSDPTLLSARDCATRLERNLPPCPPYNPEYVTIQNNEIAYQGEDWVYMLVTARGFPFGVTPNRNFVPAAHPIHLHGHDFAILAQSYTPYWDGLVHLNLDNPPRRDVALLPANGYLVIAFRTDNPGTWLMHCHIAWHASAGLALQLLERPNEISVSEAGKKEMERVCGNWNRWFGVLANHWDPRENARGHDYFQDDSGI